MWGGGRTPGALTRRVWMIHTRRIRRAPTSEAETRSSASPAVITLEIRTSSWPGERHDPRSFNVLLRSLFHHLTTLMFTYLPPIYLPRTTRRPVTGLKQLTSRETTVSLPTEKERTKMTVGVSGSWKTDHRRNRTSPFPPLPLPSDLDQIMLSMILMVAQLPPLNLVDSWSRGKVWLRPWPPACKP